MKKTKLFIGLGLLILLIVGGFFAHNFIKDLSNPELHPEKSKVTTQIFRNTTGAEKKVKINQTGYYDVITVSGDGNENVVAIGAPLVGEKAVGSYFKKGQELLMKVNGKIKLEPAKLEKYDESPIILTEGGDYFVGLQVPAGRYKVILQGELSSDGMKEGSSGAVSLWAHRLGKEDDERCSSARIKNEKPSATIELKAKDDLCIKSNGPFQISLTKQ